MDINRIKELKKVQEKQDIIENMIYSLKTSSKAINLRIEFENEHLEFYPTDKDGYEMEPNKQGLIIYLEHEIKHCEMIKQEIIREMAQEVLPEFKPNPVLLYSDKDEEIMQNKLQRLKEHMELGEFRIESASEYPYNPE